MKIIIEDQTPVLDMDIPVTLKARDMIKLNQIMARTYDEEESLRETLGPILQEIKKVVHEIESNPEWTDLRKWDSDLGLFEKAIKNKKKHLKRIKRAMLKNRNLRINYSIPGSGEITRRTIIPLELWEADDLWLLRAYCYLKGEEHTFRLDRILKAKEKKRGKRRVRPLTEVLEETQQFAPGEAGDDDFVYECEVDLYTDEMGDIFDDTEQESVGHPVEEFSEAAEEIVFEHHEPANEHGHLMTKTEGHGSRNPHYSLPGKKPHQSGLPNRLERLIKRVERKSP